jgi:hypothetical protein
MRPGRIRIIGCPTKAPMIANPTSAPARQMPPKPFIASFRPPASLPAFVLRVTDGLVSIGQQAWINGVASSALH